MDILNVVFTHTVGSPPPITQHSTEFTEVELKSGGVSSVSDNKSLPYSCVLSPVERKV